MCRNLEHNNEKSFGYARVRAGTENVAAKLINASFPEIQAFAIKQIKHRSVNGVCSYETSIMVPNYILFYTSANTQVLKLLEINCVLQILTYNVTDWQLKGKDLFCAQWLFDHNGEIGVSIVYDTGELVKIIDGPLKLVEGRIAKIDKRNRNALVEIDMQNVTSKVWLAFEYLDKSYT